MLSRAAAALKQGLIPRVTKVGGRGGPAASDLWGAFGLS
jgi:hypothetical protein